jgi:hypothetical protein
MSTSTPLSYPQINGVYYDFSSIELRIDGQIFIGFKSITYTRTRSRVMVRGNSPDPLGKTRGINEYSAECEMYLPEFNELENLILGAGNTDGYGEVFFDIFVTYTENGFDTIQDQLIACTFDSTDASHAQSADPLLRKFALNPLKIIFNGSDDLAVPLQAPPT